MQQMQKIEEDKKKQEEEEKRKKELSQKKKSDKKKKKKSQKKALKKALKEANQKIEILSAGGSIDLQNDVDEKTKPIAPASIPVGMLRRTRVRGRKRMGMLF